MTSQTKSGEMKTNISIDKDPKELTPGDGVVIDNETKYEFGSDLHTEGTPLIDPAIGKTVLIRMFEFKMNPAIKYLPSKQTLFNAHAKQIQTLLWGDGLIHMEEISPRVIIDKKGHKYQIFVPCEAKSNTMFVDKPKSLSEQLKDESTRNRK